MPNAVQMFVLDLIRYIGPLIFIMDLGVKYAYGTASRFINDETYALFMQFIWLRPCLIVAYHIFRFVNQCCGLGTK